MKSLKDFAKENSKYIKLKNGDSLDLIYHGYTIAASEEDPEKEVVIYQVKYADDVNGKTFFWKTSSVYVAAQLDSFEKGQIFKVKRTGDAKQTRYEITTPNNTIQY